MMDRSLKYMAAVSSLWLMSHSGEFSVVNSLTTSVTSTRTPLTPAQSPPTTTRRSPKRISRTVEEEYQDERYYEEENDGDDLLFGFFEVRSFQELQRSMGPDILDDTLQQQIDRGTLNANLFLEAHDADASYMEKVAMSSIPEQLPQPAVNALRQRKRAGSSKSHLLRSSNTERLSPEEEIQLAKLIQKGVKLHKIKADREEKYGKKLSKTEWAKLAGLESVSTLRREVATYRRAKQLLVSANVGLVHAVVRKQYPALKRRKIGLTYDEVVQEGSLGLLRAAELFDPSRGLRFSTYATIWIKGALSNTHMTEPIKLPARERTKWNKIVQAHDELVKEHGMVDQQPTAEQVADRIGMSVQDVTLLQRKMKQAKQVLSLDYEYQLQSRSGVDDGSSQRTLENDKNFQSDADLAERTQMQADVIAAMAKNLTPREARLMRLRYGLSDGQTRSLRECSEAMGISESRAQQLAKTCLRKLREAAEAESLEEYLLTIA
ncbi:RNA polymerase sigma factor sigA [Nitzschia inconspicua]|uniref:RNA polymerase sigma factor sigA n=1 Tax=Nitzschia inconspicua TaxID=303405 RepID=A0A9K3LJI5_9STRA|nr:RNA polymerase sigma factor sigA [Nitzschia inconspicua]